ncbi:hypothetical protein [Pseudonocardia sp. McavD-2-B]|uniref:hypothetical protein n=1 Tax=Pseudonocardia sp. McavD-2-B TaxID=2954499 RepID=UPI002097C76B|nr:hypothetical protein [Pseudonocardia sp. McavD-2-B]MCO7192299.1 hypothetical protein [Pseudonocardia sp. McavD-2-B]
MTAPTRAFDPAADPLLTVRCSPDHRPDSPAAVLAIRVERGHLPWLVITGPDTALPLTDDEVAAWPVAHPATWSPQLARDLAHLYALTRKEQP